MTHPEDRDGSIDPTDRTDEPEEDEWVARLLARTPAEPIPTEVAARLDTALADLVADRRRADTDSEASPEVVHEVQTDVPSLDARRERSVQRLVRGLLATAAVLVLLMGGAYMTTHLAPPGGFFSGGGGGGSSADSSASSAEAAPGPEARDPSVSPLTDSKGAAVVPSLTTSRFAAQAGVVVRGSSSGFAAGQDADLAQGSSPGGAAALTRCSPVVPATAERGVPVLLDGRPAVLEVYPARDGLRLVRAVGCDGAPLASASIAVG